MPPNPILRNIAATVGFAFAGQAIGAAIFVPQQKETYYDAFGSLGFLSTTAFSLYYPYWKANLPLPRLTTMHPRQLILSGLVCLWSARLGSFLFQRIKKSGKDSRFDEIKKKPLSFFGAWMAQATWISITALPVFAINALGPALQPALGLRDFAGLALWASAFLLEVLADRQKSAWRQQKEDKKHNEQFISSGLWSISRHPNYFFEVSTWAAIFVLASGGISGAPSLPSYTLAAAALSPIFEYLLITKVSGVPLLEKSSDEKYGHLPEYQKYKKETPVFWPKLT